MSAPLFSVVLIARNESKTLPRLLNSLREFSDRGGEIILVDTGSADGTAELARSFGCKVTEVGDRFKIKISDQEVQDINDQFLIQGEENIIAPGETLFDYSSARNFAATLSSNDVIATPDCDEVYTKLDIDAINAAISEGVGQLEYNFVFAHDAEGNEMVKFLHCKFYNRKLLEWKNVIHEILSPKVNSPAINKRFFEESIIKLEHFQNIETNRSHYLKGLAYDILKNPNNDRNAHYFGRELMYTGRFSSAIGQFKQHVQMKSFPAEISQSYIHMGECYLVLGKTENAINCFVKAFDIEPNRREPLMKLAEYYFSQNKPVQTMAYASAATQIKGDNYYANYQPYYEHLPHELLYWAYWNVGDINASKRNFQIAEAYQPFNSKYLHDLRFYVDLPFVSFVIPTMKRPEGLQRCIESIKNLNYPQDKIEMIVLHDNEEAVAQSGENIYVTSSKERVGVPKNVKRGVEASRGTWVVYASNDIEFTPDSLIIALKTAQSNGKMFMAFNTQGENGILPDEGNICEHFMIHRNLIKKLNNEIFDTDFNHVGVDNLLWAKMKKIGQEMWCKRAVVNHYHFTLPNVEFDDVYKLAWKEESVKKDRELLQSKLTELDSKPFNEI